MLVLRGSLMARVGYLKFVGLDRNYLFFKLLLKCRGVVVHQGRVHDVLSEPDTNLEGVTVRQLL